MARTFSAIDGLVPCDLMQAGLDHVSAAQVLFANDPRRFDSAGYLAHLGIELLLKAWLLKVVGAFEGTHNLESLYLQLEKRQELPKLTKNHARILTMLDQFEQLRYPNRLQPIEIGDSDWTDIEAMVRFLCHAMPTAIEEVVEEDGKLTKGGRVLKKKKLT